MVTSNYFNIGDRVMVVKASIEKEKKYLGRIGDIVDDGFPFMKVRMLDNKRSQPLLEPYQLEKIDVIREENLKLI